MKNEKYLCNDKKYRYIYKITILPTNQYYYGQHTLKSDDTDFYMGSGSELNKIYELSGFNIANKEICCYAESDDELNFLEKQFIGTKYKDDPLCLNKISGGNYKRTDKLKHEVASLGGKALSLKLKSDKIFAKKYSITQSIGNINTWKNQKYRKNRINGLKRFWKNHTCPTKNKIRIYNEITNEKRYISINQQLPIGWKYPKSAYIKYLDTRTLEDVYMLKFEIVPEYLIQNSKNSKNSIYVINTITNKRRRIPNTITNLPTNWKFL